MKTSKIIILLFLAFYVPVIYAQSDSLFPYPEKLRKNVNFWKTVYSKYNRSHTIIHDEQSLVIYDTVNVEGKKRRARNRLVNSKRKEYKKILKKMAYGDITSANAKKITDAWGRELSKKELKEASKNIRGQAGQRNRYLAGLKRSGKYLDKIKEIFRSRNLPLRLIYLPHVESSFNYKAYSSVGAAGLWQFMRYTGRLYMRVDYLVDERLDPIESSVAASKLLLANYRKLGTWPLAITAYNHGAGGMKRAVKKTGTTDLGEIAQKYKGRRFGFASRNFYSAFLAASEIAMNYKKYFGDVEFEPPLEYREVLLDYYYTPKSICKAFGISLKELKEYNPALRRALFRGGRRIPKGYRLRVPWSVSSKTKEILASIPKKEKSSKPAPPAYYRVQRGDCISTIATDFSIKVRDLLDMNGLTWRSKIYAGQVLVMPTKVKLAKLNAKRKTKVKVKKTPVSNVSKEQVEKQIVFAKRDTAQKPLWCSEVVYNMGKYHTQKTDEYNVLEPAQIVNFPTKLFDEAVYHLDINLKSDGKYGTIRVSWDETLSHYSDWLLTPIRTIKRLNNMRGRRTSIYYGKKLRVPFVKRTASEFSRLRLEYHMAMEEDFYSNYNIVEVKEYKVHSGDNVWDIVDMSKNSPPMWLMKKYNLNVNLSKLIPGQVIRIPELEEKN